jgi:hypothetical protein
MHADDLAHDPDVLRRVEQALLHRATRLGGRPPWVPGFLAGADVACSNLGQAIVFTIGRHCLGMELTLAVDDRYACQRIKLVALRFGLERYRVACRVLFAHIGVTKANG